MQKRFKLQKVLEYRNLMLEKEKAQLAVLIQQEQVITDEIRSVGAEMAGKQKEMAKSTEAGDFHFADMYQKYIARLEARRLGAQQRLARHRQEIFKQKGQTVHAYRRKTIMDKLKDRHTAAYQKHTDVQEAKAVEDIVITRKAAKINSHEEE